MFFLKLSFKLLECCVAQNAKQKKFNLKLALGMEPRSALFAVPHLWDAGHKRLNMLNCIMAVNHT